MLHYRLSKERHGVTSRFRFVYPTLGVLLVWSIPVLSQDKSIAKVLLTLPRTPDPTIPNLTNITGKRLFNGIIDAKIETMTNGNVTDPGTWKNVTFKLTNNQNKSDVVDCLT